METHHLVVSRTARYHVLGAGVPAPREVWIVCHGYGQLAARFLEAFRPLDDGTRRIIAPEALSRFYLDEPAGGFHANSRVGATWMTREDREHDIADYVRYLDQMHDAVVATVSRGRTSLVLLGFSQGVATVTRWCALGAVRPDRLVLWAGNLPADLDTAALRRALVGPRVTLVGGTADRFLTPEAVANQQAQLRGIDVAFEEVRYEGGHRIEPEPLSLLSS